MAGQPFKILHNGSMISVHGSTSILHELSCKSASPQFVELTLSNYINKTENINSQTHWEQIQDNSFQ